MSSNDPFAALGLPARADVCDDDVRAAWRRIAAATHPDRDDGGAPERYASAAAAYATLRTAYGRGEALADLKERSSASRASLRRRGSLQPARLARRRPGWRTPARIATAGAIVALAFWSSGWSPGVLALTVGALTWIAVPLRPNH